VDIGSGESACVFIHGIGTSWKFWLQTLPAVARYGRVIAVDLPGFGESQLLRRWLTPASVADWVLALCVELGLDRIALCGHSLGAIVSAQYAASHPGRVNRLVLVGGTLSALKLYRAPVRTAVAHPGTVANFAFVVANAAIPTPTWLREHLLDNSLFRSIALRHYLSQPSMISGPALRLALSDVGRPGVIPALLASVGFDYSSVLRRIECPTLLINGIDDRLGPPEEIPDFLENVPHARVLLFEGTGHWPMLERPQLFNDCLVEFLGDELSVA
jgi:pimeloyl-ACP methyl ester carboxylesterase